MKLVQNFLLFTCAQRNGNWDLHLYAFEFMLPLYMRNEHINYARWEKNYVHEMHQLPTQVLQVFVLMRTALQFNQVDPDRRMASGTMEVVLLASISKTSTTLSRCTLSYNLRSHMSCETRELYNFSLVEAPVHSESIKGDLSDLFGITFLLLRQNSVIFLHFPILLRRRCF